MVLRVFAVHPFLRCIEYSTICLKVPGVAASFVTVKINNTALGLEASFYYLYATGNVICLTERIRAHPSGSLVPN